MAKETPALYSVSKTFVWFAVVSALLLGSLIGIVLLDHKREWKEWQKKFIAFQYEKAKEEFRKAEEKVNKKEWEGLRKQVEDAEEALRLKRRDHRAMEEELRSLDARTAKTRGRYQDLKQYQDSYRYYLEETRLHQDPRAAQYEKKLAAVSAKLETARLQVETLEKESEAKQRILDAASAHAKELEQKMNKVMEDKRRVEKTLESLKPSLAKELLNAPMVDFMAPTLRVQQVVLEDLYDDYHFAKTQKVDRCMTCHLGIDQKGFEDAPQPFKTHPKLDLFLSPNSPHPLEKAGCTVCHGGNGHSVSFGDSAHTPRNDEERRRWQKQYGWRDLEKWEAKMLPLNHVEASCAKCHRDTVEVPKAQKLNRGRQLAEASGCFNCHKVQGFEDRWKVGPSLERVQSKLTQDWIVRWLQDPKAFRPATPMPRIFHLPNTSSPEDRQKSHALIEAMAAYLIKNSDSVELADPPAEGDPKRGERLVKEVGCLGCHSTSAVQGDPFAPPLSHLGSKVSAAWLYSWLKEPKHYSKDTRMPNLRLSGEEAADIAQYLLQERSVSFEKQALPKVEPKVLDEMILGYLQGTMRRVDAERELAKMNPDEKRDYLGKKAIGHFGCYGCHAIKGFENVKPIGTELTKEGSKNVHQFDFGLVSMEASRHAWLFQKLKEPRIFDKGKVKDYLEKLRMPDFSFTDEEAEALTTFLLSLTEEPIPLEMQKRLDLKEKQTEKGRLLVSKHNCAGCHTLDGKEGTLRQMTEDKGKAPPVLDGEGVKVQEQWLHEFLDRPVTIRPWLSYRMPTFGFTEDEIKTFVQYFAHLSGEEVSYNGLKIPEADPDKPAAGKMLFEKFQCIKCHQVSPAASALGASFLAPDLTLTKKRLKVKWVDKWLEDPQALQPGTMMPTFFPDGQSPLPDVLGGDAKAQVEAIRDHLYRYEPLPEPQSKS